MCKESGMKTPSECSCHFLYLSLTLSSFLQARQQELDCANESRKAVIGIEQLAHHICDSEKDYHHGVGSTDRGV